MDKVAFKLKYNANTLGICLYFGLLLFDIGLLSAKNIHPLHVAYREFFNHTSNFYITSMLMAVMSFLWILQGAKFKLVVWLGLVAIAFNFVVELFVSVLNTPDIVDAYYGTAGAIFTLLVMLLFQKKGLKEPVA